VVEQWIWADDLPLFLDAAFAFVGHPFDASDWKAVEQGIRGTNAEQNKWFEYEPKTEQSLHLSVAQDNDSSVVFVKAKATPEVETKIAVVLEMTSHYHFW